MAELHGQPVLVELNRRQLSGPPRGPYQHAIEPKTLNNYVASFHRIFAYIEAALRENSPEDIRHTIKFPAELRVVAEEVHGLIGPGMPYHNHHQLTFWSLTMDTSRVKTPEELEDETGLNGWDPRGWTMGGGWNSGDGQDASCCVVYCRKPDEDGWKWRYVVNLWERGMYVFESIPEFLGW